MFAGVTVKRTGTHTVTYFLVVVVVVVVPEECFDLLKKHCALTGLGRKQRLLFDNSSTSSSPKMGKLGHTC